MKLFLIVFFCLEVCLAQHVLANLLPRLDPDETLDLQELIAVRGFSLQTYTVQTADGYLLTLFRVVPANYADYPDYTTTRKPVIVQHGLLGSANDFFVNSPFLEAADNPAGCGDTLGFCLAQNEKYDIWYPNSRGTHYSMGHVSLSSLDPRYWAFSFDEMALYDTPAVIDFVRNATGHDKVGFLGYSQGANILLALLSLKPDYANAIEPAIAWAPPAYLGNMTSPAKYLYPLVPLLQLVPGEFVLSDTISNIISQAFCRPPLGDEVCDWAMQAVYGSTDHLNSTRLPVYYHFFPSTVSNWQIVHFGQLLNSGKFERYDYGNALSNIDAYGQITAPEYPLGNIPQNYTINIIRGSTDAYINLVDSDRLIATLRAGGVTVQDYVVPSDLWNHLDYVIGEGAGKLVHDHTVQILDQNY